MARRNLKQEHKRNKQYHNCNTISAKTQHRPYKHKYIRKVGA